MINQTPNSNINIETNLEVDPNLDLGDASPETTPTPAELEVEQEKRVEQMVVLADDLRDKAIGLNLISIDGAETYALPEVSGQTQPSAREIKKEFEEITKQLETDDEDQEKRQGLRRRQAELATEYAYNTTGLLYDCYKNGLSAKFDQINQIIATTHNSSPQQAEAIIPLVKEAIKTLTDLGSLDTTLEIFEANIKETVKDAIQKDSVLESRAYVLNQSLRTAVNLFRDNAPEQNTPQYKDLVNIVDALLNMIDINHIDAYKTQLEDYISSLEKKSELLKAEPVQAEKTLVKPPLETASNQPEADSNQSLPTSQFVESSETQEPQLPLPPAD